ncbi:YihY family inner membrane protein [Moraxellaceae bacterium AER2_44_116]|nr:YihY family inner membrane protein [Moraxellaceae bacterium]TQC96567.1 YihY family inner membrane protein [Moraxellaceae bacterium AER2_44_116]
MTWHSRWQKAKSFTRFVIRRFLADECRQNAASLTYTTLFAVVPMMTVLFTILAAIPSLKHISVDIQNFIFSHFLPDTGVKIQNYLSDFSTQASNLTLVGVFMLFVTALMMLITIEKAFNEIWKVKQPRQSVMGFLRYWAVLSLGPFLLGAAFAVSSYLTSLKVLSDAESLVGSVFPGLQVVPILFTALAFSLLYIAVPNCRVPVKAGFQAGVFSAILLEIAKNIFTFFVTNFSSYQLVYGAFAAFPLFLLWVYLSWVIILLGVEVCRALTLYKEEHQNNRHPVLALLDVLQLFYRRQLEGQTVTDIEAMHVLGKHEVETWTLFVDILLTQRIIQKTESGSYVLARNLENVDFWTFYQSLPWPLPQPQDFERLHEDDNWARALAPRLLAVHDFSREQLQLPLARILAVN